MIKLCWSYVVMLFVILRMRSKIISYEKWLNLTMVYDFLKVLHIKSSHLTKDERVSKQK
jgi:hypothetical protein